MVGSYAKGTYIETSDIDLVIITSNKEEMLKNQEFINLFGDVNKSQIEYYGACTSIRVWYMDGKEVEINYGSMLYDDYLDSVWYIDININNLPTRIYLNNNKVNYLTDFAYNNLSENIIDGNVTLDLSIKSNNFQVKFKPDTIIKVDGKLEDYLNKVELSSLDRDNLLGKYNYINLDRELFVNSLYETYNLYIPLVEKKNLDSQIFLTIHYCIYNDEPLIVGEKEEYMASDQVIISKALYDYLFDEPFEKNMVYDFRIPERKTNPIYQEIPDMSYSPFDHGMRIIGIVDSNEYKVYCDYFTLNSIASQYSFYMVSGYAISNNIDNIKKIYELGDYINYNVKINVDSFETNINNLLNNKQFLLSFNKYNGQELADLYDNLKNNKEFNTKKISVFFINEDNLKSISRSNDINSLKGFAYLFSTHNKWEEINDVSKNYYVYMINLVKSNLIKNGGKYLDEFIRSLEGNEISKKLSIYDKNYVFTASDLYIRIDKTSKREVIKAYKKLVESVGNNDD